MEDGKTSPVPMETGEQTEATDTSQASTKTVDEVIEIDTSGGENDYVEEPNQSATTVPETDNSVPKKENIVPPEENIVPEENITVPEENISDQVNENTEEVSEGKGKEEGDNEVEDKVTPQDTAAPTTTVKEKVYPPAPKPDHQLIAAATPADTLLRIKASMLLAGVGDALGYKNGAYEFCRNGAAINGEVKDKGGVEKIKVDARNWMVSDDTVMHIATAEALVSKWANKEELYLKLAKKYKECMRDMSGRAPGNTCMTWTHQLKPKVPKGYVIPFNPRGGGCGAAMRAVPIGLYFNRSDQLEELVAVSIESGRMTHNHPTGYLGALAVALFVSYAFQKKPLVEWGIGLMQTLDIAWEYIKKEGRDVEDNKCHWNYFKERWTEYLTIRVIDDGCSTPTFPDPYDAKARDEFYKYISFSGWGGSSGHDAPMIAYDALLGCEYNVSSDRKWSWAELCSRGMFHGGDSDSTGIIAAACWGAMRGYEGVPECNYKYLEYRDRLEKLGKQVYENVKT